jgi:hypothetical protein
MVVFEGVSTRIIIYRSGSSAEGDTGKKFGQKSTKLNFPHCFGSGSRRDQPKKDEKLSQKTRQKYKKLVFSMQSYFRQRIWCKNV